MEQKYEHCAQQHIPEFETEDVYILFNFNTVQTKCYIIMYQF